MTPARAAAKETGRRPEDDQMMRRYGNGNGGGTQQRFSLRDNFKRYFRLSGVPLKFSMFILGCASIFLFVRSF